MSGPSKLPIYDAHGVYSPGLALQLVSGIELTAPAPDAFLEHLLAFITEFPETLQQEIEFEPLSASTRNHIIQVFRGFQEPQSAEYLLKKAPILGELFLETLTYYLGPSYSSLRGSGCMGTRDNAHCGCETCVPTYVKKPTSFTYGTCGLLSCAQNRFVYQLRENNLKRVRRNFCAFSQHLPYCLPVECDAEAYGFERCRLCATTFHRSCALTLFLEGDYAFKLDPSAQLICSNRLLVLPQTVILFSTVASALANNGTLLKYLVVIPTHTTASADIQYRALQDASSEFDGLIFAWVGDALMDTEDSGLSGTPAAQRDPSRAAILALRKDLVTTATRKRAARTPSMRSHASESVDTPEDSIPEGNYGLSPVHMDANLRATFWAATWPRRHVVWSSNVKPQQFPRPDRFLTYCRKRMSEWSTIQRSGLGVFAPAHQPHVFHHRTALLVQARYGFMIELVEHAGLEWPWCTWESLYVCITTHYVSMWELQPFSGAVRLDRDLLRFQYEEHYGDVREVFRQYVLDTISPTKVLE
eukprot:gene21099-25333_t